MKELSLPFSPRSWKLLCLAAWGLLIVLILALLPFLVDVLSRLADWFTGLLPHPFRSWEESPWLY
jgi:hypothetical protein